MNYEIIKELENEQLKKEVPQFNVGDTVRVHNRIKEGNRERIQIFEGTVLKIQGGGPRTTFTVRKESSGIGVEKTWPLHSPNVEKVDVVRRGKVRRAKLNYLRSLSGKKAKVKALNRKADGLSMVSRAYDQGPQDDAGKYRARRSGDRAG